MQIFMISNLLHNRGRKCQLELGKKTGTDYPNRNQPENWIRNRTEPKDLSYWVLNSSTRKNESEPDPNPNSKIPKYFIRKSKFLKYHTRHTYTRSGIIQTRPTYPNTHA